MARCYSVLMHRRQSACPILWAVTDARNDAMLECVLARLPRRSGVIFRHYHLDGNARRTRFAKLARLARRRGHVVVLAGCPCEARRWRADGAYGPPRLLARGPATMRLATVHSLRELARAQATRADAVLLSPVFPTRSHPGGKTLGPVRFRLLAARAGVPVVALGGMDQRAAARLRWRRWAAIDGICGKRKSPDSQGFLTPARTSAIIRHVTGERI